MINTTTQKQKLIYNRPTWLVNYQRELLDDPSNLICIEGGTKSGKSACMAVLALEEGLRGKEGDDVYWIAPVADQSKVGFDYINEFIQDTPLELKPPTTGHHAKIYLCNGVTINFVGNGSDEKSTNRLYGNRAIFTICDEASRCCPEIFKAIISLNTQTKGSVCMIGNVLDRANWYYSLCRRIERKEVKGSYYKITYRDAIREGILEQEKIDEIKLLLLDYEFAALYECDPIDSFKNPFGLQHIDNAIEDYDINSIKGLEYYGVDIGRYKDRTCIIGMTDDGYIGVVDVFLNDHTLQKERIHNVVGDSACYMDTTGITAGDVYYDMLKPEMTNLEPYGFTNVSKKELISNLALYIQKGKIHLPKNQDLLITELKNYELKLSSTGTVTFSNNKLTAHDDTVCALALCCMAHKNLNNRVPYDFF